MLHVYPPLISPQHISNPVFQLLPLPPWVILEPVNRVT